MKNETKKNKITMVLFDPIRLRKTIIIADRKSGRVIKKVKKIRNAAMHVDRFNGVLYGYDKRFISQLNKGETPVNIND